MVKLARAQAIGNVVRGSRSIKKEMSLEAQNEFLSKQIAKVMFKNDTEALKVNKAGVVTNLDYNNENHKRWLED